MHERIAPKTTVGNVLKQFRKCIWPIGLVARSGDEPFTLIVVTIPCGHMWKYRSQRLIEAHASAGCVSYPFATSVPCKETRRSTWRKRYNFCAPNRVRDAESAFHSTGAISPKLNVEGSNPFARFGGDGGRGYGGRSVERNRTGAKWCPARVQTVSRAVESTGLPGVRGRGLFQHLRGSMFCGALAKCDLADFGCDLFQRLWVCLRGDVVPHHA
jgi:hypothetical protein